MKAPKQLGLTVLVVCLVLAAAAVAFPRWEVVPTSGGGYGGGPYTGRGFLFSPPKPYPLLRRLVTDEQWENGGARAARESTTRLRVDLLASELSLIFIAGGAFYGVWTLTHRSS